MQITILGFTKKTNLVSIGQIMRGKIFKRYKGSDSWTIIINIGIDPDTGKRKQQWITVHGTKKDAEKRLAELLHQIDTGTYINPSTAAVEDFLARWIKDYKHNLSPRGFERYRDIVNKHLIPEFGKLRLTQLRPEHIQRHYTDKLNNGLSARTVRYHHAVLRIALKTAVKQGLLARNPADAVNPPKIRRTDMQVWDQDEMNRFLEVAKGTTYHELFYTALFTGMRRSELLALRWNDVDLVLGQIYVNRSLHHLKDGSYVFSEPKSTRSRRTIALSPSTSTLLRNYREKRKLEQAILDRSIHNDDLIFSHPDGSPLRPNTVTNTWRSLAARAGVKVIRFHDGRHSHASLMLKQGIHPKIVSERLGHSTITMTIDLYSHVQPGIQEAAAARFDELLSPRQKKETPEKVG